MFDPLLPAGLPSSPAPQRAAANTPNLALLLGLLHTLIGIGQSLVQVIEQHGPRLHSQQLQLRFGTNDLRLILARVVRGLHRATALYQRLAAQAAAGRDLAPTPLRPPTPPRDRSGGSGRGDGGAADRPAAAGAADPGATAPGATEPGTADPAATAAAVADMAAEDPAKIVGDAALAQILAHAASDPAGAVLAEICRDLGIFPGVVDPALVIAVYRAISQYNGSVHRWLRGVGQDRGATPPAHPPAQPAPEPAPPPVQPSPVRIAPLPIPIAPGPQQLPPPPPPERMAVAAGPP